MALGDCLETLKFHATQCVQEAIRFRRERVPSCADNHVEPRPIGLSDTIGSNLPHQRTGALLPTYEVQLFSPGGAI